MDTNAQPITPQQELVTIRGVVEQRLLELQAVDDVTASNVAAIIRELCHAVGVLDAMLAVADAPRDQRAQLITWSIADGFEGYDRSVKPDIKPALAKSKTPKTGKRRRKR